MTRRCASVSLVVLAALSITAMPGLAESGQTNAAPPTERGESNASTRAHMAKSFLQAMEGGAFSPPACVPGSEMFNDVPATSPFCRWIEELFRRGITAGCGNGNFCPSDPVPREQMAVFLVASQGPRAQALITFGATVRPELQKGSWTARRPNGLPTGIYCVAANGIDATNTAAIVTAEWGGSGGSDLLAYWVRIAPNCVAGEFQVHTYSFAAGGQPQLSNNVEFLIVIP